MRYCTQVASRYGYYRICIWCLWDAEQNKLAWIANEDGVSCTALFARRRGGRGRGRGRGGRAGKGWGKQLEQKTQHCVNCNISNHTTENCRKPLKLSKCSHNTGNDIVCYHCMEVGHPKKLCPVWKWVQETFDNWNSRRVLLENDNSKVLVVVNCMPGNAEDFDWQANSVALLSTMVSPATLHDSTCFIGSIWMPELIGSAGPIQLGYFALVSEVLSTT